MQLFSLNYYFATIIAWEFCLDIQFCISSNTINTIFGSKVQYGGFELVFRMGGGIIDKSSL